MWLDERWELNKEEFKPLIARCHKVVKRRETVEGEERDVKVPITDYQDEVRVTVIDRNLKDFFLALAQPTVE